uniref:3-phosphoinositide-dependent protein kinase 1 n=1 Tax=Caenorhabditis japonica TaxID=281687 RepID=A0A8R1HPX8_CAEJA
MKPPPMVTDETSTSTKNEPEIAEKEKGTNDRKMNLELSKPQSATAQELITRTFSEGCPQRNANDFKFIRGLGEGAYSNVILGQEVVSGAEFAIKVIQKSHLIKNQKMDAIAREKNILNYLTQKCRSHPFISQLYTSFHDHTRIYFVMELVEGGDLSDSLCHFGSFDLPTTKFFASEILSGLKFLHDHYIVHRDMKPENILIKMDGHVVIADFGSAQAINGLTLPSEEFTDENQTSSGSSDSRSPSPLRYYSDDEEETMARRTTFVGTALYVSPEMLTDGDVGAQTDIWGLGCIIFQCLAGQPPFRAVNQFHLLRKIQTLDFTFPEGFPPHAIDVLQCILVSEPSKRIKTEQLMTHPFFENVDWENIANLTPPVLHAYIPATFGEQEYYSNIDVVEPGLDDRAMLRLLNIGQGTSGSQPSTFRPILPDVFNEPFTVEITPRTNSQTDRLRAAREKKLDEQQMNNNFHLFTNNMLILKQGYLEKKRGFFARRRMFLLTEGPHLLYIDVSNMVLKGEIPWTPCMQVELKNSGTFFIHTPNRVYYLFDLERKADEWCKAIDNVRKRYAKQIEQTFNTAMQDGTFGSIYGKKKSRKEIMREQKALRRKQVKDERKAMKAEQNQKTVGQVDQKLS